MLVTDFVLMRHVAALAKSLMCLCCSKMCVWWGGD